MAYHATAMTQTLWTSMLDAAMTVVRITPVAPILPLARVVQMGGIVPMRVTATMLRASEQ
jgi:hypothetical protein